MNRIVRFGRAPARFDEADLKGYGWLGRAMDPSAGNLFSVGGEAPTALRGRRSSAVAFKRAGFCSREIFFIPR